MWSEVMVNLTPLEKYSGIPIFQTLSFFNLPIIRAKSRFPSSVEYYNKITPDFSNSPIFEPIFISLGGS